tara:strand:+ start:2571 stop:3065 length:495 start_codon:yes stop_codon:yes gene_type:complete
MQVAKINADNEIEEVGELKTLFPNTSFPANGPSSDWYKNNNVMSVTVGLSFDPAEKKQEPVDPYISDGVVYTVRLVDLTNDEKTAYTNAQDSKLAASQRANRDRLLAETDWMAIKAAETGVALANDWKTYRQALRDLPSHSNWPNLNSPGPDGSGDNDWPVKPS